MKSKVRLGGRSLALAALLAIPLVYWTWCWGWWGRDNLLMTYLFQCRCPAISEAERYKPYEIVASACTEPKLFDVSATGRFMTFLENRQRIIYDVVSGERRKIAVEGAAVYFLRDDLVLVKTLDGQWIYDLRDNVITPLRKVDGFISGSIPTQELRYFQNAERIFEVDEYYIRRYPK